MLVKFNPDALTEMSQGFLQTNPEGFVREKLSQSKFSFADLIPASKFKFKYSGFILYAEYNSNPKKIRIDLNVVFMNTYNKRNHSLLIIRDNVTAYLAGYIRYVNYDFSLYLMISENKENPEVISGTS